MYSEFSQFSFLAAMSNSEICLTIKQDTTSRKDFDNISSLESAANVFQDHVSSSKDQELDYKKEDTVICTTDDDDDQKKLEQKPFVSLGQYCSSSSSDDGFRTPTSLDHKIPVITHCPPPPRKITPSRKRKLASPRISGQRKLLLDLSKEVDSMFPQALQQDIGRKMKKARRDDDDALT